MDIELLKEKVLDGGVDYVLERAKIIKLKNESLYQSALGLWNALMSYFDNSKLRKDEMVKLIEIKRQLKKLEQQNYDSTKNG